MSQKSAIKKIKKLLEGRSNLLDNKSNSNFENRNEIPGMQSSIELLIQKNIKILKSV